MTTIQPALAPAYSPTSARAVVLDWAWHAYAVVVAATMVVVGLLWDISWHMSIGRDTFWTPAHLLIQSGGLLAGVSSGVLALHTTFRGTAEARASAVSFWGSALRSVRGSASSAAERCSPPRRSTTGGTMRTASTCASSARRT